MTLKTRKIESLALIDSIGLTGCFMLQNECPPISKSEVRQKQSVNYSVRKVYKPGYWRTHRVQSGLKLNPERNQNLKDVLHWRTHRVQSGLKQNVFRVCRAICNWRTHRVQSGLKHSCSGNT